jgi:hypothetical protein
MVSGNVICHTKYLPYSYLDIGMRSAPQNVRKTPTVQKTWPDVRTLCVSPIDTEMEDTSAGKHLYSKLHHEAKNYALVDRIVGINGVLKVGRHCGYIVVSTRDCRNTALLINFGPLPASPTRT